MALSPGTRLGAYEILSLLGAGGMGEVYRAKDTKLGREIALKILPASFTNDPERVARFRREAQVLASLNHPHIGAIYGLDEANGQQFLVLELVDGESLDRRIARGAIPVDEALGIAKQIAEALEAAHEKGIVHRDLKPANIALTSDGNVKVLDFGLAKAVEPPSGSFDLTKSPTITSPARMTSVGVILGTAAYMAPEQAKGRAADKRSDIWAFGCVLYEMVTSKCAFAGEDVSDTLAAVLRGDPDWTQLPSTLPVPIRRLLRRCVEKDPRRRLESAADVRLEIEDATSSSPIETTGASTTVRHGVLLILAGVAGGFLIGAAGGMRLTTRTLPQQVTRFTISPTGAAEVSIADNDRTLSITPDGSRVVYVGANGTRLFVRALDQIETTPLVNGWPRGVFTSPDGQWVGYIDIAGILRKVSISGGPVTTILTMDGSARGATWLPDDSIVFATNNGVTGLQRVSAVGGPVTVLTRPNHDRGEAYHVWPERLPGGRAVLFTITSTKGGLDAAQIAVLDLATGAQRILLQGGTHAQYVASGHLVYAARGTLRAVAFDVAHLTVSGPSVPVLPRILTTTQGGADVDVAANGTLTYMDTSSGRAPGSQVLVWVDRQGREQSLDAPPRAYTQVRLSPDGTRVALYVTGEELDLWIWDLARTTLTRLTSGPGQNAAPLWTQDSRRIIYRSQRGGAWNLFWQAADGTGVAERLLDVGRGSPTGMTPDGTQIVFEQETSTTGWDLMLLSLTSNRRVTPLLATRFDELRGVISPDGRWLAYESNSSGQSEVYVRPFPNVEAGQSQVSTAGGMQPLWSRNGRELFYVGPDGSVLAVPIATRGGMWNASVPAKVVENRYRTGPGSSGRNYDVSLDGQRFLMIRPLGSEPSASPPQITVVEHWFEELKARVPTK